MKRIDRLIIIVRITYVLHALYILEWQILLLLIHNIGIFGYFHLHEPPDNHDPKMLSNIADDRAKTATLEDNISRVAACADHNPLTKAHERTQLL